MSAIRVSADSGDVILDGLLDEPIWQTAPAASGFRQREPLDGAPATEETEVRVVYDETTLYVGILAFDSRPDAIGV